MPPLKPIRGIRPACGDEEDSCGRHPAWGILGAVLGGLAQGAGPILATVLVHKLWPEMVDDGSDECPLVMDSEEKGNE